MFLLWLAAVITASAIGGTSSDMWPGRGGSYASETKAFPKHYDTLYVQYAQLPDTQDGERFKWEKMEDRFRRTRRHRPGVYVTWNGRQMDDDSEGESYTVDSERSYYGDYYIFVSSGKKTKKAYALYPRLSIDHKSSTTIVDDTTSLDALKVIRDTTITADLEVSVGSVPFLDRWRKFEDKSEQAQTLVEIKDSLITLNPIVIKKEVIRDAQQYKSNRTSSLLIVFGYIFSILGGILGLIIAIYLSTRKDPVARKHGHIQLAIFGFYIALIVILFATGHMPADALSQYQQMLGGNFTSI